MIIYIKQFIAVLLTTLLVFASAGYSAETSVPEDTGRRYVKAYYPDIETAHKTIRSFEPAPPEVDYENGYIVMFVTDDDIIDLSEMGFTFDEFPDYSMHHTKTTGDTYAGIPGYSCYATVEETFQFAEALAENYPDLATWIDVGNSWEKETGQGGYDMKVLKLTNSSVSGDKPKLFITAAIHAREYTTAALAYHFAKELVENYQTDADIRWILDYNEIHLMLQANPDGRKKAEAGYSWRKNTNQNYCGSSSSYRGADLNRNFDFHWGGSGASSNECSETFRGASAGSEPETQAVQNYLKQLYPDYNGSNPYNGAPDDASGLYIDIHSYSELVLWPWGDSQNAAPNGSALKTLGHKFAYFNDYTPQQSVGLYPTSGTTDDYAYGELGVAAYCFELGTAFFQSCGTFESTILPDNLRALIYAAKVTRAPYMLPYGPDVLNVSLSGNTLSATIDDTRFQGSISTQTIAEAEYYVDTPPWESGASAIPMNAADGGFNEKTETVSATLSSALKDYSQHIIYIRGKDASGNWGPVSAVFYEGSDLTAAFTANPVSGQVPLTVNFTDTSAGSPTGWQWDFGDGTTSSVQNPSHEYTDEGSYTVVLTVTNGSDSSTTTKSNLITVSEDSNPDLYCEASGDNYSYEYIREVAVGSFSNSSQASGYSDFTDKSISFSSGASHEISLTPGFAGSAYSEYWRVWIDLNQDNDFNDPGETVFEGSGKDIVTGNISIPDTASTGATRMRVSMQYNGYADSCGSVSYGEVEDYTVDISGDSNGYCDAQGNVQDYEYISQITIGDVTHDSGASPYSDYTETSVTVGTGSSVALSLTPGYPDGSFAEFWRIWADLNHDGDFNDAGEMLFEGKGSGTVTGTLSIPENADPGNTRMRVAMQYNSYADPCGTLSYGEVEDYTLIVTGGSQSYCDTGGNVQDYEFIRQVDVDSFSNSSEAGSYSDFTGMTIPMTKGQTHSVTLAPEFAGNAYNEHWIVRIDLNQDMEFDDAGEIVFRGTGDSAVTGTITIPETALSGTTRMRVSMRYNNDAEACGTIDYGEVEDYTVTIE